MQYRILLALVIMLAAVSGLAQAADTPDQKAVRARRTAFARAFAARDSKGVFAFIDPSFSMKRRDGQQVDYDQLKVQLEQSFKNWPTQMRIVSKIDKVEVNGAVA
jgi:hypothetical protein